MKKLFLLSFLISVYSYGAVPTATYTKTLVPTWTRTATKTATETATPNPSFTHTPTKTETKTSTATKTPTKTPTTVPTFTRTFTKTRTSTATQTQTNTGTLEPLTSTFTSTATKTATPTCTNCDSCRYAQSVSVCALPTVQAVINEPIGALGDPMLPNLEVLESKSGVYAQDDGGIFDPVHGSTMNGRFGVDTKAQLHDSLGAPITFDDGSVPIRNYWIFDTPITITDSLPVTYGPITVTGNTNYISAARVIWGSLVPGVSQPAGVTLQGSAYVSYDGNYYVFSSNITRNPSQAATPIVSIPFSGNGAVKVFYEVFQPSIGPTATLTPYVVYMSYGQGGAL